jgi:hypothetical protein
MGSCAARVTPRRSLRGRSAFCAGGPVRMGCRAGRWGCLRREWRQQRVLRGSEPASASTTAICGRCAAAFFTNRLAWIGCGTPWLATRRATDLDVPHLRRWTAAGRAGSAILDLWWPVRACCGICNTPSSRDRGNSDPPTPENDLPAHRGFRRSAGDHRVRARSSARHLGPRHHPPLGRPGLSRRHVASTHVPQLAQARDLGLWRATRLRHFGGRGPASHGHSSSESCILPGQQSSEALGQGAEGPA